jgi:hypothetical protein
MKIDDQYVLPCDFVVGHIRYGKGVKLETVRAAAARWLEKAEWQPEDMDRIREALKPMEVGEDRPPLADQTDHR